MHWLWIVSYFFGGAFLANAIPHSVSGLMGRAFQSPFAKPPGRGVSSATLNVLWGFLNLVISYLLVCAVGVFELRNVVDIFAFGAGFLLLSLMLARHFGHFNGGNLSERK